MISTDFSSPAWAWVTLCCCCQADADVELLESLSHSSPHSPQAKLLKTPETIPFRLTQDIIDGMGITGTEGVFRASCEHALEVLRKSEVGARSAAVFPSLLPGGPGRARRPCDSLASRLAFDTCLV